MTLLIIDYFIRATIEYALKEILKCDFPDKWPGIVDNIHSLLSSDNQSYIYAGVEVFNTLCGRLRFCDNIQYIDNILSQVFPFLKKLMEYLLNADDQMSQELKLWIIKSFRHSTYFKVTPHFLNEEVFGSWMELFFTMLKNNPPYEVGSTIGDKNIIFKQKKWIGYIFTRYISRYCRKRSDENQYAIAFRELFFRNCAIQFTDISCNLLLSYIRKEIYFPRRIVTILLNYIATGVLNSTIWTHIKPNILNIFQELIIPIVSLRKEDIEIMENDPHEWIRLEHDPVDEYSIPKYPAVDIITESIQHRSFNALDDIMNIILNHLNAYQEDPLNIEKACMKFGILEILKRLNTILSSNPNYSNSLEELLVNYIFPDFQSPYPFIVSKVNNILSFFADITFNNEENILTILNFILQSMNSEQLIVSVEATLTLRHFMKYPNVQSLIHPILPDLFRRYFELMELIDNDDLVSSLHEIIDYFGENVAEYSLEITKVLSSHFIRIKSITTQDDDVLILTCINILAAIHTILKSIKKRPELIQSIQEALVPVLIDIVSDECPEFIDDIVRILVNLTYYTPVIIEGYWTIYDHLVKALVTWSPDYIDDYLPILDNMISRDNDSFINSNRLEILYDVFRFFLDDLNRPLTETASACQLVEVVFYQSRGKIDHAIPHFINTAMSRYKETESIGLRVFLIEVVVNALYNSPISALNALESANMTQYVLNEIYLLASQDEFLRRHDKRCLIFGLSTFLEIPFESLPESIKSLFKDLSLLLMDLTKKASLQSKESNEEEEEENVEEFDEEFDTSEKNALIEFAKSSLQSPSKETPDYEDVDSDDGIAYDDVVDFLIKRKLDDDIDVDSFEPSELPTDNIKESIYFVERFENVLSNNSQVRQMFSEEDLKLYESVLELAKSEQ